MQGLYPTTEKQYCSLTYVNTPLRYKLLKVTRGVIQDLLCTLLNNAALLRL